MTTFTAACQVCGFPLIIRVDCAPDGHASWCARVSAWLRDHNHRDEHGRFRVYGGFQSAVVFVETA